MRLSIVRLITVAYQPARASVRFSWEPQASARRLMNATVIDRAVLKQLTFDSVCALALVQRILATINRDMAISYSDTAQGGINALKINLQKPESLTQILASVHQLRSSAILEY